MATLQSKIAQLASDFASGILEIVRGSSFEELAAVAHGRVAGSTPKQARTGGRLARRSEEDIAAVVDKIVKLLGSKPNGLRAEQIREELGLESKELPRPLADAMSSKKVKKSGNKRATTYFLASKVVNKPAAKPKKVATKKAASKPKAAVKLKAKAKSKAKSAKKTTTKAKAAPAAAATANGAATSG